MIDLLWFRARKAYRVGQAFGAGIFLARYPGRQIYVETVLAEMDP